MINQQSSDKTNSSKLVPIFGGLAAAGVVVLLTYLYLKSILIILMIRKSGTNACWEVDRFSWNALASKVIQYSRQYGNIKVGIAHIR